jgi:hypothetical protein
MGAVGGAATFLRISWETYLVNGARLTGSHLTLCSQVTVDPAIVQWRGQLVEIDLEKDNHDHMVSPEERLRVVMARQVEKSDEGRIKRNSIER